MTNKTLLFRNLFVSEHDKENNDRFHQAMFYLASALRKEGSPIIIADSKFSLDPEKTLDRPDNLNYILKNQRELNLIVVTLLEGCFDKTKQLCNFIRKNSKAFIAVGGIMPTSFPEQVLEHLPEANIIVRGEGEQLLPKLQKILQGTNINTNISNEQKRKIQNLQGIIFRNKQGVIHSKDMSPNIIKNMDECTLDFSILNKENVERGITLSTSRGCHNHCFFCTMPTKGTYRAKSFKNLKDILVDYKERLIEIYQEEKSIPSSAFNISFNDDDFLGDRKRAIQFFNYIKDSPFKVSFIQTAINSFFMTKTRNQKRILDKSLIDSIDPEIFCNTESDYMIYLGTENFCNQELKRLGKDYSFKEIVRVIRALSKKRVTQAHHLILSNVDTTLDNIFENLETISTLKEEYPETFDILRPVIPNLVSFYGTASYNTLKNNGKLNHLKIRKEARSKDPNLRFPFVECDLPLEKDVMELASISQSLFSGENYHKDAPEKTLLFLIRTLQKLQINETLDKERIKNLSKFIDGKKDYFLNQAKRQKKAQSKKKNLQIMLSRRCQLRCTYCPVPKKDSDSSFCIIKRSIDLLLNSDSKDIRVDFTGGEPLLRFDLLKRSIRYAIKKGNERKKKVSFYIVTNALNLNKEVVDFLEGKEVLLELSIDGDESTHNKFKIPADKRVNAYKETTKNISLLDGKKISRFIVLVATPYTVHNLYSSFTHIHNLGFNEIEVNYAIGMFWDNKGKKQFFSEMSKIIDTHKEDILRSKVTLGNLDKRSEPAALNSEFMIDTDGKIRLLNEFLFKSKVKRQSPYDFGTVFDHKDTSRLIANKFMVYYSIMKMFCDGDQELRKVIENNLNMGLSCTRFFNEKKKEIGFDNKDKIRERK